MNTKRVGIIGYGALGKILARGIVSQLSAQYTISGILEMRTDLRSELKTDGFKSCQSLDFLLNNKPDIIVEIASGQAVREYGDIILKHKIPLIITSVGALADDQLYSQLLSSAQENHTKIYIPSGAIGGLDIMQTLQVMGNTTGIIETRKAPDSLNGAPYLNGHPLSNQHRETAFQGTAREAITGFPKNVNVAVASALASAGIDQMQVIIESCPGQTENIHKITCKNDLAKAVIEISSSPDPTNPKSSTITAWSIVALLKSLASPIELR
ncbi:MAG: DUF108 domain-containing protein [Clostridiales bacterium]|nr:DUF108 domain-containing protein [Clostridiales bacterium]